MSLQSNKDVLHYQDGNRKYKKKGRGHRVMIINQCSATECPSRKLGFCQLKNINNCYAYKQEVQYPLSLPFKREQKKQWGWLFAEDFIELIQAIQDKKKRKFSHLRFAESGDFSVIKDIYKLSIIAEGIREKCNMATFTYTARKDLIRDKNLKKWLAKNTSLVINGAGFMVHNEYRIVPEGYEPKHKKEVWCRNNCHICKLCKIRGGYTVLVKERTGYTKAAIRESRRTETKLIKQSIV